MIHLKHIRKVINVFGQRSIWLLGLWYRTSKLPLLEMPSALKVPLKIPTTIAPPEPSDIMPLASCLPKVYAQSKAPALVRCATRVSRLPLSARVVEPNVPPCWSAKTRDDKI